MKHTKAPWKPCRSFEDFKGPYYEPEKEDLEKSFVKICSIEGNVTSNHDLFEFKNKYDAYLIAAAPEMLEALEKCRILLSALKKENLPAGLVDDVQNALKKARGE